MKIFLTALALLFCEHSSAIIKPFHSSLPQEKRFAAAICSHQLDASPNRLWNYQIFEAQVSGKLFRPYKDKPLTAFFLKLQSEALAQQLNHHSHSYGKCEDGTGWVASWPAPEEIQHLDNDQFTFSKTKADTYCKKITADFANNDGGFPKEIPLKKVSSKSKYLVDASKLPRGTVSLTCTPKAPNWQGPTLWYLLPIKGGPGITVPNPEVLYSTSDSNTNVIRWVNNIRKQEGLAPLAGNTKPLLTAAKQLSNRRSVIHNRDQLKQVRADIKRHKINLIGENRFRGDSLLEIAWLLWNSPQHRSLLLNAEAKSFGIAINERSKDKHGVAVFAR